MTIFHPQRSGNHPKIERRYWAIRPPPESLFHYLDPPGLMHASNAQSSENRADPPEERNHPFDTNFTHVEVAGAIAARLLERSRRNENPPSDTSEAPSENESWAEWYERRYRGADGRGWYPGGDPRGNPPQAAANQRLDEQGLAVPIPSDYSDASRHSSDESIVDWMNRVGYDEHHPPREESTPHNQSNQWQDWSWPARPSSWQASTESSWQSPTSWWSQQPDNTDSWNWVDGRWQHADAW